MAKRIFEIVGKGKGLIETLTPANLLELNSPSSGASTFVDLTDTPNSYSGQAGKIVSVKSTEDGLEFIDPATAGVGTLQQVTDNGATTSNPMTVTAGDESTVLNTNGLAYTEDNANYQNLQFATPATTETFTIPNETGVAATRGWVNAQGFEVQSNKGAANGYTPLNASSKIDATYLPDSILGQVNYQGTWNASTNSPSIPIASSANKGYYYIVNVAGTTTINGINDWQIGDWIISNGTTWSKVDNTDAISSFNGRTGAITLVSSDVTSALGFTPENSDNKATTMTGNASSNSVFLTAKAVYDWVMSLGFITDVITALGFTPANSANTSKLITSKYTGVSTGTTESVIGFKQVGNAGNGSSFLIYALANMGKSNGSNSGTIKFYLNTANDLTGSPIQIGVNSATSALSVPIERTYIYSGGVLYGFNATTNAPTDRANGTAAELALTIDLVSTTYYLIATVQTSNAATTVNSRALEVSINPNVT